MGEKSIKEVKSILNLGITIQIFFIVFISLIRDFLTDYTLKNISYQAIIFYALTLIGFFITYGLLIFFEIKLSKSTRYFKKIQ